jgi:hypothetical protein
MARQHEHAGQVVLPRDGHAEDGAVGAEHRVQGVGILEEPGVGEGIREGRGLGGGGHGDLRALPEGWGLVALRARARAFGP